MRKNIVNMYKIELEKVVKRRDISILFIFGAISFLLASSVLSPEYKDVTNQSALYWFCKQLFNWEVFMVSPMVFAYIGSKMLSTEIESKSISLYTVRIRDKKSIYIGKSLALITFVTLIFFVIFLINILAYYIIVVKNYSIASNTFLGENNIYLIITIIMLYFFSFILISQLALFLGTFFNQAKSISIIFVISLILNNTFKLPIIRYINPLYYIVRFSDEITSSTNKIGINFNDKIIFIILFSILCCLYTIIFNILAINKFERSEL